MQFARFAAFIALVFFTSCSYDTSDMTRSQTLKSGKTITLVGVHFAFGAQDNKGNDSFAVEYVVSNPKADQVTLEQEAWEVFELVRSVSEQWGLKEAQVSAFPSSQRKGSYTYYRFHHSADGKWAVEKMPGSIQSL